MKFSMKGLASALTGLGAFVGAMNGAVHATPAMVVMALSIIASAFTQPVAQGDASKPGT